MRVPRAVAKFNRRFTNPLARSVAGSMPGLGLLEHVGRKSGKRYRTPLNVFRTPDGYVVLVGYGLESNWVKNVMASGTAVLHTRGQSVAVGEPRLVSKAEGETLVTPRARPFYRVFPYDEAALVLTETGSAR